MHLIVPFASADADAARDALRRIDWRGLDRFEPRDAFQADEASLTPPHERAWAQALGLAGDDGALPLAAVEARAAGLDPGSACFARITPVHWQLGADHASLLDPAALELTPAQSDALCDALRPLVDTLQAVSATRWLASGDVFDGAACASIDRAIGRRIEPWLPASRALRRLQNEAQMVLHAHPVNAPRTLPVNSIWIDGCGRAPSIVPAGDVRVDDTLRAPALAGDWPAWQRAWQVLLATDFGGADRVTLCGERGAQRLDRRAASWWRRLMPTQAAPAWLEAL